MTGAVSTNTFTAGPKRLTMNAAKCFSIPFSYVMVVPVARIDGDVAHDPAATKRR